MKLYTFAAPNPLRVSMFLAEKNIEITAVPVALLEGASRKPDFLKINSLGEVPVLELDDGSHICESVAICRYLESLHPEPSLFGKDARQQAHIEMWNRRMERHLMDVIGAVGLHTFEFFKEKIEQNAAYAESQRRLMAKKWAWLDEEISDGRPFVAGDAISVADLTGAAALKIQEYAQESIPGDLSHARAWAERIYARPGWPKPAKAA